MKIASKAREYLPIGTVSSATMREEDLIPAFLYALEEVRPDQAKAMREDKDNADVFAWLEDRDKEMPESVTYFLNEDLWNALDEACPPYCYFGATEGDGCDYGCWPAIDSLEDAVRDGEVLKVSDTADVPADYQGDVMHVNDHGNVTLYAADCGKLTEIWAAV